MNKIIPIIMVVAFWGIFLWGMYNPKVGEAIIAITLVGIVIGIVYISKKILWTIISKSEHNSL